MPTGTKIIDEFTDLSVSKQRKWQLRHPEKYRELKKRFRKSPVGRASRARYDKGRRGKGGSK